MPVWDPLGLLAGSFFLALALAGWWASGVNAKFSTRRYADWLENPNINHPRLPGLGSPNGIIYLSLVFYCIWAVAGTLMWTSCVTTTVMNKVIVFTDENGCSTSSIWLSSVIFYMLTWASSFWWVRILLEWESPLISTLVLLANFVFAGVADGLFWGTTSAWAAAGVMLGYVLWSLYLLVFMIRITAGDQLDWSKRTDRQEESKPLA